MIKSRKINRRDAFVSESEMFAADIAELDRTDPDWDLAARLERIKSILKEPNGVQRAILIYGEELVKKAQA